MTAKPRIRLKAAVQQSPSNLVLLKGSLQEHVDGTVKCLEDFVSVVRTDNDAVGCVALSWARDKSIRAYYRNTAASPFTRLELPELLKLRLMEHVFTT